jgi:uroporphyrin-III C-methyltransferase
MSEKKSKGIVYLVGAGPGDPELLTIKASKILQQCDVVIYDALMNPSILEYISPKAEKIFIGPSRDPNRITQKQVEDLMVKKANEGKIVVRLKGGDPFVFGRGGEEAEVLTKAEIEWDVIPGISSGLAVPAYACIPLTHRNCADSVTFITGHEGSGKPKIEWNKIKQFNNTLVIFMGIGNLSEIVKELIESNYKKETPIAVIESGTTEQQKIRISRLDQIVENANSDLIKTPALIVIGEAVKYREKLLKYFSKNLQKSY